MMCGLFDPEKRFVRAGRSVEHAFRAADWHSTNGLDFSNQDWARDCFDELFWICAGMIG